LLGGQHAPATKKVWERRFHAFPPHYTPGRNEKQLRHWLDGTHSQVDVETEFSVVSLILLFYKF